MGYHKAVAGVGAITLMPTGANPTGIDLALVSSLKLDVEEEDVDLDGEDLDVVDSFPSTRRITFEAEVSEWSAQLVGGVTAGTTISAANKLGAVGSGTIPTTPFQITITPPGGGTFGQILAVVNLSDGKAMTRVASAPATGQFSISGAVLTFASADQGDSVFYRYQYTLTTGAQAKVVAAGAGSTPAKYAVHCYNNFAGKSSGIYIPAARIPGLSAAFERKGWVKTTIRGKAVRDAVNDMAYIWTPE
jgi:hypothetical protein